MKTRTQVLNNGANNLFMVPWKDAGALVRPNGMTLNSYSPLCVLKALLGTSEAATLI